MCVSVCVFDCAFAQAVLHLGCLSPWGSVGTWRFSLGTVSRREDQSVRRKVRP